MPEENDRLRKEAEILERLENAKRLIQMETTLLTAHGARMWCRYQMTDRDGKRVGLSIDDLLHDVRGEIQLQLLSIVALCYGDNPDVGEPFPMLEWNQRAEGFCPEDRFREVWDECLSWNA